MRHLGRLATSMGVAICSALAVGAVLALFGAPVVGALPALTATPTPPPRVTLSLTTHRETLLVGETLTVTADLSIIEGCIYPIYELILQQNPQQFPTFSHIDPPTDLLSAPIQMPSVWTFMATQPGYATFDGRTLGEINCDGAWIWMYVQGSSERVTIVETTHQVWLPAVAISTPQ